MNVKDSIEAAIERIEADCGPITTILLLEEVHEDYLKWACRNDKILMNAEDFLRCAMRGGCAPVRLPNGRIGLLRVFDPDEEKPS